MSQTTDQFVRRGKLHVRPDEEPDVDYNHSFERDAWLYGGCFFCGQTDHRVAGCPARIQALGYG